MPASPRRPWSPSSSSTRSPACAATRPPATPRFSSPSSTQRSHVQQEIQNLDNMAGSDPDQKNDIDDLRERTQDLAGRLRSAGDRPGPRPAAKTSDVDLNLHGKVLMDAVRHDLNDIIHKAEDNRERAHRTLASAGSHHAAGLLFLALGMGILIGLFTRNRLHSVSAAYRNSLEILSRRAEELFQSEQKLAHHPRLHRRRRDHLRRRRASSDDESRGHGADRLDASPRPADSRSKRSSTSSTRRPARPWRPPSPRSNGSTASSASPITPAHPQRRDRARTSPTAARLSATRTARPSASFWSFATSPWSARPRKPSSPTRSSPSPGVWPRRSHTRSITRSTPSPTCSTSCATARTKEESKPVHGYGRAGTGARHADQPGHARPLSRIQSARPR